MLLIKKMATWQFKALNILLLILAFICFAMGRTDLSRLFVVSFALTNAFEIGVQAGAVKPEGAANVSTIRQIHEGIVQIHAVGLVCISLLVAGGLFAAARAEVVLHPQVGDFIFSGVCIAHYCLFGLYSIQREEFS
jgi:hypothetical protein